MDELDAALGALSELAITTENVEIVTEWFNRVDAARVEFLGEWDRSRTWEAEGAKSAAAMVAHRTGIPRSKAREDLRLARDVRDLPETGKAFAAGRICRQHVQRLAAAHNEHTVDEMARDEAMLVELAEELSFAEFSTAVRYWSQLADPDRAERDARARRDGRYAFVSRTLDDVRMVDARLDPVAGSLVEEAIRREADALFRHDWAEAKARVGDPVTVADLARTPAQRRADALVALVERGARASEGAGERPLLNVLVDHHTLIGRVCELADGTVVTPGQVADRLSEADIRRIVFAGPDTVVSVGRRTRFFRGHLRHAVEIRDRICAHPTCDVPAARCEVDHVVPYPAGPTSIDNAQLLCRYHHRRKTRGDP